MRNKEKQVEFFKLLSELAELQTKTPDKTLAIKLKRLIGGLLEERISIERAIRYVDNSLKNAKNPISVAFWAEITNTIKKYFEKIS